MGMSGLFLRNSMASGIAIAAVVVPRHLENEVLDTAVEALEYAKANAPWADRSGDAREGLDTDVYWEGHTIVWDMFHTVDYGLYLETRWNAKYAIIMPTLEMFSGQIGRNMSESGGDYV